MSLWVRTAGVAAVAALLAAGERAPAQEPAEAPVLEVRRTGSVDESRPDVPHVEPWLTVDAADPERLLAGAIVVGPDDDGPWHCAGLVSADAGRTWRRHDFAMERCIDPWLQPLGDGAVLFTAIEIQSGREAELNLRLLAFRSEDGGLTWSETPLDLGRGHDHAMLTRAPGGALLAVSQRTRRTPAGRPRHRIGVLRSDDGGRSFRALGDVAPSNLGLVPTGLGWLSDGTLVVAFQDFQRDVDGFGSEGGLRQPRAWVLRSRDLGRSFSEPLFASEGCGRTSAFAGYPALAVDASERHRDRLYHLCVREAFDGLALTRSDDGGERWSDPVRLARGASAHVRTPMLAVGPGGTVVAAWYDRSDDPERACQDVYAAVSGDGGTRFSAPQRVSLETSCPAGPGNGRAARSWAMGGDYGSLAAAPDGTFHLLWADSRTGVFQIHHAALGPAPAP